MVNKPFSDSKKGGDSTKPSSVLFSSSSVKTSPTTVWHTSSGSIRDSLTNVQSKVSSTKFDRIKHKDTKRSQIAMIFVVGFIAVVAIVIIGAPVYNAIVLKSPEPLDIERLLAQVGALIGTPLGFVIGYYFKEDK